MPASRALLAVLVLVRLSCQHAAAASPLVPPTFGLRLPPSMQGGRRHWEQLQQQAAWTSPTNDDEPHHACPSQHALEGFCAAARATSPSTCLVCVQDKFPGACTPAELNAFCSGDSAAPTVNTTSCYVHATPGGQQCGTLKRCYKCPNATWASVVEATGLLSVKLFGAKGDSSGDDAPAVRAAINATQCCGGCVWFPPGVYQFNSTVMIPNGCVKGATGSNTAVAQSLGTTAGSAQILGPAHGPALAIIDAWDGTLIQDLNIQGSNMGLLIRGAAGVRLNNVYIEAVAKEDDVDTTAEHCNATACNIVWGSMNAAM